MTSKKLFNTIDSIVPDAVQGTLLTNPHLKQLGDLNILIRDDIATYKQSRVTLISGGGSGHEPAHAGFVGMGMLSAAVLGNVFASPSVNMVYAAIKACAGSPGVLLIVKNYTGDRLNFGVAVEKAKQDNIKIRMVIVDDDSALPVGKGITGGRGLAGTVLVHKIAGALAENNCDLEYIYDYLSANVIPHMRTLGVAFTTCTVPGTPVSTRLADASSYEVGLGIHGEPGREQRVLPPEYTARTVAQILVEGTVHTVSNQVEESSVSSGIDTTKRIRTEEDAPRHQLLHVVPSEPLVLLLNNLGGLPQIEMLVLAKEVVAHFLTLKHTLVHIYTGAFVTSLEMNGVSLTVLKASTDAKIMHLLAQTTSVPAWVSGSALNINQLKDFVALKTLPVETYLNSSGIVAQSWSEIHASMHDEISKITIPIIRKICEEIIRIEPVLTQYDMICGDGDCGIVMKAGATKILCDLFPPVDANSANIEIQASTSTLQLIEKYYIDISKLLDQIATSISNSMGGTSGILLEIFFRAMSSSFLLEADNDNVRSAWVKGLLNGSTAIQKYGGAAEGMRTMLDALIPATKALIGGASLRNSYELAACGVEATKTMSSLAGRSNYINQEQLQGTPDPGAVVVATIFKLLAEFFDPEIIH